MYDKITIGMIAAITASYVTHGSVAWAAFHGLFGWLYLGYYAAAYVLKLISPL